MSKEKFKKNHHQFKNLRIRYIETFRNQEILIKRKFHDLYHFLLFLVGHD
jgi:hypothetical protein